jgi:hypothetical protein
MSREKCQDCGRDDVRVFNYAHRLLCADCIAQIERTEEPLTEGQEPLTEGPIGVAGFLSGRYS